LTARKKRHATQQAARVLIGEGSDATIVTVNPSGAPNVSVVWVALNSMLQGDDI
jgi:hypothetical protein